MGLHLLRASGQVTSWWLGPPHSLDEARACLKCGHSRLHRLQEVLHLCLHFLYLSPAMIVVQMVIPLLDLAGSDDQLSWTPPKNLTLYWTFLSVVA